jgi:hypothetical protein
MKVQKVFFQKIKQIMNDVVWLHKNGKVSTQFTHKS